MGCGCGGMGVWGCGILGFWGVGVWEKKVYDLAMRADVYNQLNKQRLSV
jgi:hypothetical protein